MLYRLLYTIFVSCIFVVALSLLSFSCTRDESFRQEGHQEELQKWFADNGKIKVLCTTSMVADVVQRVGGDAIDCLTLIRGEHDPHSYQLVKGDDEKFSRADIVFYNGLGLEHGPSLHRYLEPSAKAFSLGEYVRQMHPESVLYADGVADPHIWMDMYLFSETCPFIAEELNKIRPNPQFAENCRASMLALQELSCTLQSKLRAIPEAKRYLVTSHDAFTYFTRRYLAEPTECVDESFRRRCQAPEGLAPESQMSTADIQRIVEYIVQHSIHVIFTESNVSRDSIKKLQDAASGKNHIVCIASKALYADSMGKAGDYAEMMQHNVEVLVHEWQK